MFLQKYIPGGERFITECTVLRRADQASLWKHMMTEVLGSWDSGRIRSGALHQGSLKTRIK